MKAKELRDQTTEELTLKERDLRQEVFNLKLQKAAGQLANTAGIVKAKKDLARVKTILRSREIAGGAKGTRAQG
ncbi:MAG: 50S ribosomal protein L29 [Desulfobacteraceae bacterium]|nr:MAG: 50S ribosomal protein L29 [Desulfobacteraceae bacterium]